jgi:hypothetical protein
MIYLKDDDDVNLRWFEKTKSTEEDEYQNKTVDTLPVSQITLCSISRGSFVT